MNKSLVTAAMLLPCFLAHSQEADEPGGAAELNVIARAEYLYSDPLGNTSLYTLLEGSLSEHFSYSVSNHWLSSTPGSLYTNTFRSDDVNWLDWAYLTYSEGAFDVNLGKMPLLWGTYEFDEYDYDIHLPFASSVWNCMNSYQWGLSVTYNYSEWGRLEAGVSTSPYGEHFFTSGLYSFGARAVAEGDFLSSRIAYYGFQTGDGLQGALSAGIRSNILDNLSLTFDVQTVVGSDEYVLVAGQTASMAVDYAPSDEIGLRLYTGFERNQELEMNTDTAGALVAWSPLENVRLHALCAYKWGNEEISSALQFSVGLTCSFGKKW
jgi:hypothetical protein